MGTIEITFKHENEVLSTACGVKEHTQFITESINKLVEKLRTDETYLYSNAMEDIIQQTRKYLGLGNEPVNIWTDDILSVFIAYELGVFIGEQTCIENDEK